LTITAASTYKAVQHLGGADSVDAIPRVFEAIRQQVYADLLAGHFCPPDEDVRADYGLNVNEWQKRGLPHAHMIAHFPKPMWTAHDVRLCRLLPSYTNRPLESWTGTFTITIKITAIIAIITTIVNIISCSPRSLAMQTYPLQLSPGMIFLCWSLLLSDQNQSGSQICYEVDFLPIYYFHQPHS
jgi:hypothetical protein